MNIINAITNHATALIDGTCYRNAKAMNFEQMKNTGIKMLACALIAGIIAAIFNPILTIFAIPITAVIVFTIDTANVQPAAPASQRRGFW